MEPLKPPFAGNLTKAELTRRYLKKQQGAVKLLKELGYHWDKDELAWHQPKLIFNPSWLTQEAALIFQKAEAALRKIPPMKAPPKCEL